MDEFAFRSSQKIENIQVQAQLAATKTKDVLSIYSQQTKEFILRVLKSAKIERLQANVVKLCDKVVDSSKELKTVIIYFANPVRVYHDFLSVFGKRLTKRDIYVGCAGLFIGVIIGISIGITIKKREPILQYMRAIHCKHYTGCESVTVVEDAIAPCECGENEVLVNVKAASIQFVDVQICNGYGRTLRNILQRVYKRADSDMPVILGRDCTGIITDIGSKVKRLEVGDQVWLALPFWSQGTLCQTVLVPENYVSRKPKNIGFEGASSLPYAGSLALSALEEADTTSVHAQNKKILVHGSCTPVGCILVQLLNHWDASVTTTCYKKAVPIAKALGASDVIVLPDPILDKSLLETEEEDSVSSNVLLKELEVRGEYFDVIIQTSKEYTTDDLRKYCKPQGAVISTLPPHLPSDSYGFLGKSLYYLYIKLKYELQTVLGIPVNSFDETHLCYVTLDRLAEFVEEGYLQTVVDKVFVPEDIELAMNHIQNPLSIGSSVVTFR